MAPHRILTAAQHYELKNRYVAGETLAQLALAFGIHHTTVRKYLVETNVKFRPRGVRPSTQLSSHPEAEAANGAN